MTFFLDENFPKKAVDILVAKGHDVIDIRGSDKEGMEDLEIFRVCQGYSAVFLTTDRDFFHSIHLVAKPHHGIVVITLQKPNSTAIIGKLEWFLTIGLLSDIKNKCVLILDDKYSIYR